MNIFVGVPTFNRGDLVRMNGESLRRSRLPAARIFVVDDASDEYDIEFLKAAYPEGANIERREINSGGASYAVRDLMSRFVASGADGLVILDSDMIVAADFAERAAALLPEANGILSLFNTPAHAAHGARGPFVLKRTVGSAGTVWPRDLARKALEAVPPGKMFDWRFSDFLVNAGYEICVLRDSAAQHIGLNAGQNTPLPLSGDFGVGFVDDDPRSAYFMIEQIGMGAWLASKTLRAELQSAQSAIKELRAELKSARSAVEGLRAQLRIRYERTAFRYSVPPGAGGERGARRDSPDGCIVSGPFQQLQSGKYRVRHDVRLAPDADPKGVLRMDVAADHGRSILASRTLTAPDCVSAEVFAVEFVTDGSQVLEFRIHKQGAVEFSHMGALVVRVA